MGRYRLSPPAKADVASVLRRSETLFGAEARTRYRGLLTAALRQTASDPLGPLSSDRGNLAFGLRSFHIRHCRSQSRQAPVAEPVHVIFYRMAEPGIVDIVRLLHERMEPSARPGGAGEQ